jgi:hypothetical protein
MASRLQERQRRGKVRPNNSIDLTASSARRALAAATHVER